MIWIDGKSISPCRVICERANGPPPFPKAEAAHSCGKGHLGCVNPLHLRWATRTENMADTLIHGTRARGERVGGSKLREADVHEIRRRLSEGEGHRAIAAAFSVDPSAISNIHRRRSWGWLQSTG